MRENQNLTIGILSITATVLLVAVIFVTTGSPNPAMAIGQTDKGGDYIVVTGQYTPNFEQVYITDAAARKLNAYSYDQTRREIVLWDSQDLAKVFASVRK
jgi:hypothetical protein